MNQEDGWKILKALERIEAKASKIYSLLTFMAGVLVYIVIHDWIK